MKQLLVLSGKGGTGKTTITGAFVRLSEIGAFADCDVDAPNLHLILEQKNDPQTKDYFGMDKASIDQEMCIECGICKEYCHFHAIGNTQGYQVDPYACEGCSLCRELCPVNAIRMVPYKAGDLILHKNEDQTFSTALLKMGSGNSGLLVTEVKKQLFTSSDEEHCIIDGSPGIGCPVIASLSGVDTVLLVAEPSLSGISDMERIISTARGFHPKIVLCVNKWDANPEMTRKIEEYAIENSIVFAGRIPYDNHVVQAVNQGVSIVDFDCAAADAVKEAYRTTMDHFNE
ncbi:MAG TPA: ATPase [Eubacteriaceae bacterium]|nr:ATPase [Eubacteriaceae bacterium]